MSEYAGDVQEQVRQLAHEFAAAELRPHVERWDRERALDPTVLASLAELGFFGMLVPEEYGGLGFDVPASLAVLEELAWGEPAVALLVSIHNAYGVELLVRHGSEEQRRRWLGPMAGGEVVACAALAEPEADSELAGLSTRAVRSGGGWTLDGMKSWVTNGRGAGLAVVAARTDESGGNGGETGVGVFLIPTDAPGYEVEGRETTMGLRAAEIVTVRLRGVAVGADSLVGDPAAGSAYLAAARDLGRLGMAAIALGIARAALEHAVAYADQREQFGQKLREFEGVQFKLADMATRVEAARALLQRAAAERSSRAAAMAKLFASEAAMWVTTQAVQIFGGYGYMRDYPVEKLMRDAKATELCEGTSETQRVMIARELYR